jgi:hypothetical protein
MEALQPYDRISGVRIDDHPLFILRELSNTDKHRAIYYASHDLRDVRIVLAADGEERTHEAIGPFRPGDVVLKNKVHFSSPPKTAVQFAIHGVSRVTFEEFPVRGKIVSSVLSDIIAHVETKIIPQLERFATTT